MSRYYQGITRHLFSHEEHCILSFSKNSNEPGGVFQALCPGKVLALRLRLAGCHTYRPLAQSDAPSPLCTRWLGTPPDPTYRRGASSLAGTPRLSGGRDVAACCYWPQSTSLHGAGEVGQVRLQWRGGSFPTVPVIGGTGGRRIASPSAERPELLSVSRNRLSPFHLTCCWRQILENFQPTTQFAVPKFFL